MCVLFGLVCFDFSCCAAGQHQSKRKQTLVTHWTRETSKIRTVYVDFFFFFNGIILQMHTDPQWWLHGREISPILKQNDLSKVSGGGTDWIQTHWILHRGSDRLSFCPSPFFFSFFFVADTEPCAKEGFGAKNAENNTQHNNNSRSILWKQKKKKRKQKTFHCMCRHCFHSGDAGTPQK